jgi:uncharacterized protein with von Willebrand factor type A (vWA) domain
MIFVIDNSGSMAGESMEQARASLLHALRTLNPADRFNVIRFDDTMTQLFDAPVAANAEQVELALRFANRSRPMAAPRCCPRCAPPWSIRRRRTGACASSSS